jgi:hypothetical protein
MQIDAQRQAPLIRRKAPRRDRFRTGIYFCGIEVNDI